MKKSVEQVKKELYEQLKIALQLEHATLPPYLYAFWSMKDLESPIAKSLYEVIKEEMLHLSLACNILNAIGGSPDFSDSKSISDYPTALPAHDMMQDPFIVGLNKMGIDAIITFLHIELPRDLGLPPSGQHQVDTIGSFYEEINANLLLLPEDEFKHGKQLDGQFAPFKAGELFTVNCQEDALRAVAEIIEQGEGLTVTGSHYDSDKNHFNRFLDIYRQMGGQGEVIQGKFDAKHLGDALEKSTYLAFQKNVKDVVSNPKKYNNHTASFAYQNKKFNSSYSKMLDALTHGFNMPAPNLTNAIQHMFALTRPALEIMSVPIDANDLSKGFCGPTFEYLLPGERIT